MERTVEKLRGWAQVSVCGAEPALFLNCCASRGVMLMACRAVSPTELGCIVPRRCLKAARDCAAQSQCTLTVLARRGGSYTLSRVRRRYALLAGLLAVLLLLGASSLRIWDIDVRGNEQISRSEILGALESCGVFIGADWTGFSADRIRSQALQLLPELSFLTVNVHGSRATVIVRERIPVPEMDNARVPESIIAAKCGVIESINVFRGAAAVAPGSAVLPGDVLISGTVPGIELWDKPARYSFVSALGEVWARTTYEFTAAAPLQVEEREETGRTARNFALVFGKKRLNFYKNTGIYRTSCDTIYNILNLEAKDLFTLPFSLVQEVRKQYVSHSETQLPEEVYPTLQNELAARLKREIGPDGQILSQQLSVREENGWVYMTLRAVCRENIAVRQTAEIPSGEEEST